MFVQTVTGDLDPAELGPTLPHEHLFTDLLNQYTEPEDPEGAQLRDEVVQLSNLGVLRRNPYLVRDNLIVDDADTCVQELAAVKQFGIKSLVDCSTAHRYPAAARAIAERTGLNVILGCGYYTYDTHPPDMDEKSAETIADEMIEDLTIGIDGGSARAGVMGEIGTSAPIRANERKALLGAALAFKVVDAGIHVHTFPWARHAIEAADWLIHNGVTPSKIAIDHLDVDPSYDYIRALLQRGVFVEFDCFGKEYPIDPGPKAFAPGRFATDIERIKLVLRLLDAGYAGQIFLANDLCFKIMLKRYGGWGYAHVPEHIIPALVHRGVDDRTIQTILVDNPARFLSISRR